MNRLAAFAYGLFAYVFFLAVFLYVIGFLGGFIVPKTINSGPKTPLAMAVAINMALLALFAVQHTIMARCEFKQWWTRIIPAVVERSTFVLLTSAILALLYWQWRPIPATVWNVEAPGIRAVFHVLFAAGFGLVLYSTFLIDHFELFGFRQVVLHLLGKEPSTAPFQTPLLYRLVRHPLMLGFIIAFWATPNMTVGHLLFAVVTTVYIFIGVRLEERELVLQHGESYEQYRQTTPMLLPFTKRKPVESAAGK